MSKWKEENNNLWMFRYYLLLLCVVKYLATCCWDNKNACYVRKTEGMLQNKVQVIH